MTGNRDLRHDNPDYNIVLTGFMGTGKSTVGRSLADVLHREFVDTDSVIEAEHGPVAEIFADAGETRFRALERELVGQLAKRRGLVIATGGGMLLDSEVADLLQESGRVFCLVASPGEIAGRVSRGGAAQRPLLAGEDPEARITELLDQRAESYARFEPIATDGRSVTDIVDELIELIGDGST